MELILKRVHLGSYEFNIALDNTNIIYLLTHIRR